MRQAWTPHGNNMAMTRMERWCVLAVLWLLAPAAHAEPEPAESLVRTGTPERGGRRIGEIERGPSVSSAMPMEPLTVFHTGRGSGASFGAPSPRPPAVASASGAAAASAGRPGGAKAITRVGSSSGSGSSGSPSRGHGSSALGSAVDGVTSLLK